MKAQAKGGPAAPLLLLALCCVACVVAYMYRRGGVYVNKLQKCAARQGPTPFCGLRVFRYAFPHAVKCQLDALVDDPSAATRVNVPGWKAGKTIPTATVRARAPAVVDWYISGFAREVASLVGARVDATALSLPTSCAVLVYDQAGDFINWHFDVNYFRGRFFTVLLPITSADTCTKFVYRDAAASERELSLRDGTCVVFEGDTVFHMASKLCAGQKRAVLSLQYATDPRVSWPNSWLMRWKDAAYVGP